MANSEEETKTGPATKLNSESYDKSAGDGPLIGNNAKRKSTESVTSLPSKKLSFGFGLRKPEEQLSNDGNKKTSKISMNFGGMSAKKPVTAPIKLSLAGQKPKESTPVLKPPSKAVANVFNADEESDEEEMPPEAKMKMRNVGKFTPTAAGPNSFGKGGMGFCDRRKMKERELKEMIDKASADKD